MILVHFPLPGSCAMFTLALLSLTVSTSAVELTARQDDAVYVHVNVNLLGIKMTSLPPKKLNGIMLRFSSVSGTGVE